MSMEEYSIRIIDKQASESILTQFHYLSKQGFSFKSGVNYGLFYNDILIGVAIYNGLSVPETAQGCFGLTRTDQTGLYELGRLALDPDYYIKNLTSWFLSRTIKLLRKTYNVRAIITYADSSLHNGYIYQATNFKYYGLSTPKCDFWIKQTDGTYIKHQRGKLKGLDGEWRPRTQKHRYVMVFDKSLKVLWEEQPYPKAPNVAENNF